MSALVHPETAVVERWSLARRVGFRFFFVYCLLFHYPFPFGWIPGTEDWSTWLWQPFDWLNTWLGHEVLGVAGAPISIENGSGDTAMNYVFVLLCAILAGLGATAWSLLSRRRLAHPRAHAALRGLVRYALALMLISYGLAKVIKTQFPEPSDGKLLQQVGELSPMGLLWLFMGSSHAYTVFGGFMELVPAALLLSRRTATIGALFCAVVMSNIVLLNFSYDVPVKINSLHYLAFSLWLLLPQAGALLIFFSGGSARLVPEVAVLPAGGAWPRVARFGLIAGAVASAAIGAAERLERYYEHGDGAPRPAFVGVWAVERHMVNAREASASERWKEVRLRPSSGALVPESGERRSLRVEHDPASGSFTFTPVEGGGGPYRFAALQTAGTMELRGVIDGLIHVVRVRKRDAQSMLLVTRGFHWVNEVPFNR